MWFNEAMDNAQMIAELEASLPGLESAWDAAKAAVLAARASGDGLDLVLAEARRDSAGRELLSALKRLRTLEGRS